MICYWKHGLYNTDYNDNDAFMAISRDQFNNSKDNSLTFSIYVVVVIIIIIKMSIIYRVF